MATIGQLRAALAILNADGDDVTPLIRIRDLTCADTAEVQHAMLAGLLYRVIGAELARSLATAPDLAGLTDRARAASPRTLVLRDEDLCARAHFEAYWLSDRIAELYSGLDSIPRPLVAAAHSAEATRTLLGIHADLDRDPRPETGHTRWESVLEQLDRARTLARDAFTGTVSRRGFATAVVDAD